VMYRLAQQLRKGVHSKEALEKRCQVLALVYQTMQIPSPEDQQPIKLEVEDDETACLQQFPSELGHTLDDAQMPKRQRSESGKAMRTVIVSREDIGRELMKMEARVELTEVDPTAFPPLDVESILLESLKHKHYDMAWVLIRDFDLPAYDLIEMVCTDAIFLDKPWRSIVESDHNASNWVISNRQFVGDFEEKLHPHWRVFVSYMDLALHKSPSDTKLLSVVGHTFLKYSIKLPNWLEEIYKRVDFGGLLILLVEYEDLKDAFDLLLPQIDHAITRVAAGEIDYSLPIRTIQVLLNYARTKQDTTGLSLPIEMTQKKMQQFHTVRESVRRYDAMSGSGELTPLRTSGSRDFV